MEAEQDAIRKLAAEKNRYIILGDIDGTEVRTVTSSFEAKIVMHASSRKGMSTSFTVFEIPDGNKVAGFIEYMKVKGLKVEVDEPVFPVPITPDADNHARRLQQDIPWGINKVFLDSDGISKLPNEDDFPEEIVHRICIIDSGYHLGHPDLPEDATNADPLQGPNSTNPFSIDGCTHGENFFFVFVIYWVLWCELNSCS